MPQSYSNKQQAPEKTRIHPWRKFYRTAKKNYFDELKKQKSELESQIEKVQGKKDALVRMLQAQYAAEEKADLHSVQKLTEELVGKILWEG